MNKNKGVIFSVLVILLTTCYSQKGDIMVDKNKFLQILKKRRYTYFYNAVYGNHVLWVKELLEKGVDPNYCHGEAWWVDSNPLNVVSRSFYNTYYSRRRGAIIPDPTPDVAVFQLLIKAGADINRRPYIWSRVYLYNNSGFARIKSQRMADKESVELVDMQDQIDCYVNDVNRLLEAFLEAGADPDKLGHPYPYSYEAIFMRLTDEQANEYFCRGSRAINVAIEKGIRWESQVDLLLQYTSLDEESLRAAERSNDPAMIEKIRNLWEEQKEKNG
jgi:hypothetical protein